MPVIYPTHEFTLSVKGNCKRSLLLGRKSVNASVMAGKIAVVAGMETCKISMQPEKRTDQSVK